MVTLTTRDVVRRKVTWGALYEVTCLTILVSKEIAQHNPKGSGIRLIKPNEHVPRLSDLTLYVHNGRLKLEVF